MASSSSKYPSYQSTKLAISECLKQFNDFTNCMNEVCNQANLLGRSLQSLEELAMPELIGRDQVTMKSQPNIFKKSTHLADSLDTFSK
jgi:hypothetical protein